MPGEGKHRTRNRLTPTKRDLQSHRRKGLSQPLLFPETAPPRASRPGLPPPRPCCITLCTPPLLQIPRALHHPPPIILAKGPGGPGPRHTGGGKPLQFQS